MVWKFLLVGVVVVGYYDYDYQLSIITTINPFSLSPSFSPSQSFSNLQRSFQKLHSLLKQRQSARSQFIKNSGNIDSLPHILEDNHSKGSLWEVVGRGKGERGGEKREEKGGRVSWGEGKGEWEEEELPLS